eukprot:TRINITY_DN5166_c0_g3_i1.p1 TRINITY_DN5166_c0_g3~~TRINITY_DN5166_c0_g3_i1.p1  ORF type:complete len:1629 (-),score=297.62 TRINITY_DN5166_c0_g3_i1:33-4919(-)
MQRLEFRISARDASGNPWEPLVTGDLTITDVRVALERLAPTLCGSGKIISGADASGEEVALLEAEASDGRIVVRLVVTDTDRTSVLHEFRDLVLSGDFDVAFTHAVFGPNNQAKLQADRTQFAEQYEESVLAIETLTPHQHEKLHECAAGATPSGDTNDGAGASDAVVGGRVAVDDVHLKAPAGAGKTFVALHQVLDYLRSHHAKKVLFVARNAALACFAAVWLGKRMRGHVAREKLFRNLHFLHEPFERGVCGMRIKGRCVQLVLLSDLTGPAVESDEVGGQMPYALVVVDEAHHVYSSDDARRCIEAYIARGDDDGGRMTRRLLLSDLSQSLGRRIAYPDGLRDVVLSEVVRCSKRIVAGAMAFQLGGDQKLLTRCHHESTGPPLRSFLFDLPRHQRHRSGPGAAVCGDSANSAVAGASEACSIFYQTYAEHTLRALEHVVDAFPGLSLHNRVAILVPDEEFLEGLRPQLVEVLRNRFPERRLRLVNSIVGSSDIGHAKENDKEDENNEAVLTPEHAGTSGEVDADDVEEWLVYDLVGQVDGLERLIIVGVGLDSTIRRDDTSSNDVTANDDETDDIGHAALERRSMLYRAITRAHLMFLVVNEFLRGGWLEFLGSIRLRDDEAFDSATEINRAEASAVEDVVMLELISAVTTAAEADTTLALKPESTAVTLLAAAVAKWREKGKALDVGVEDELRRWKSSAYQASEALQAGAAKLQLHLIEINACVRTRIKHQIALEMYNGCMANLSARVAELLEEHRSAAIHSACDKAIGDAALAVGRSLAADVIAALRLRVASAMELGEDAKEAARKAVNAWFQVETQIWDTLQAVLEQRALLTLAETDKRALQVTAVTAVCKGQNVQQSVECVVTELLRKRAEIAGAAALEAALVTCFGPEADPVCSANGRVRLVSLISSKELNNKKALVESFVMASSRWKVRLDDGKAVCIRPVNIVPLEEDPAVGTLAQGAATQAAPLLRKGVNLLMNAGKSAEDAATSVVMQWRTSVARVSSALDVEAASRKLHIRDDAAVMQKLVLTVLDMIWDSLLQAERQAEGQAEGQVPATSDEPMAAATDAETPEEAVTPAVVTLDEAVRTTLRDWQQSGLVEQREMALILSALEAAASSQRLLLTDAAIATLKRRVTGMLRSGDALEDAVDVAMREWHAQVVRKKVKQTVWDPSGNVSNQVTDVVRFMPFRKNFAENFHFMILCDVFQRLPFETLGTLACVSKSWRSVVTDPSWKPDLVAYAWGAADVTGFEEACPKPTLLHFSLTHSVVRIVCSDQSTMALTEGGDVWFWGKSWLQGVEPDCPRPTRIPELQDVMSVAVSPAGYHHLRRHWQGYSCAAITRSGALYAWGFGYGISMMHGRTVSRPSRVSNGISVWRPMTERALLVAVGLNYIALCVERWSEEVSNVPSQKTSVIVCGCFSRSSNIPVNCEYEELRDVPLRQLAGGAFHCCALTKSGDVYTFGDRYGPDGSNGDLLGQGNRGNPTPGETQRLDVDGLGPVAEVSCTSYCSLAITVDGRAFSWGDCDGNALGHTVTACHTPTWIKTLQWQRVAHGALAYTNGAVATMEGRVFVWGGHQWEGGIARGRHSALPTELSWSGVPSCYRCSSLVLGFRHGYLIFRKQP